MKKLILFLVCVMVLAAPVYASGFSLGGLLDVNTIDYDAIKNNFNNNLKDMPWYMKSVAGDEKINIVIISDDGTSQTMGMEMEGGLIKEIQAGPLENPTMEIEIGEENVRDMINSGNPIQFMTENFGEEGMKIEAIGLWAKIKLFFMGIGISILSIFSFI